MFYNKDQIDSAPTTGCTGNEQFERLVDVAQVWEVQDVCIYDNHSGNQFYKSEVGPYDEPMKTASDCKAICISDTDCVGYFYRECTNCLVCLFYNKDQIDSAPTTGCTGNEQFERLVTPATAGESWEAVSFRRHLSVKENEKLKNTGTIRSMIRLRGSRQPSNQ